MRGEAGNKKSLWYLTVRNERMRGEEPPTQWFLRFISIFCIFELAKIQRKSSEKSGEFLPLF